MQGIPTGPAPWWAEAVTVLQEDEVLGAVVRAHPEPPLSSQGNLFRSIANAIVGQQISVAAADAIWARLEALTGPVTPEAVLAVDEEALRACGLTRSKASYLRGLAEVGHDLLPADWSNRSDDDLRRHLMRLRGVGPWTAEMVLVFVLMRPDVFSPGDIGLVRAVQRLVDGVETAADAAAVAERWAPWRTAASWFLWRTIDPEPVLY